MDDNIDKSTPVLDISVIKDNQIEQMKSQINDLNVQVAQLQVQNTNKDLEISKLKAVIDANTNGTTENTVADDYDDYVSDDEIAKVAMEMS